MELSRTQSLRGAGAGPRHQGQANRVWGRVSPLWRRGFQPRSTTAGTCRLSRSPGRRGASLRQLQGRWRPACRQWIQPLRRSTQSVPVYGCRPGCRNILCDAASPVASCRTVGPQRAGAWMHSLPGNDHPRGRGPGYPGGCGTVRAGGPQRSEGYNFSRAAVHVRYPSKCTLGPKPNVAEPERPWRSVNAGSTRWAEGCGEKARGEAERLTPGRLLARLAVSVPIEGNPHVGKSLHYFVSPVFHYNPRKSALPHLSEVDGT